MNDYIDVVLGQLRLLHTETSIHIPTVHNKDSHDKCLQAIETLLRELPKHDKSMAEICTAVKQLNKGT